MIRSFGTDWSAACRNKGNLGRKVGQADLHIPGVNQIQVEGRTGNPLAPRNSTFDNPIKFNDKVTLIKKE